MSLSDTRKAIRELDENNTTHVCGLSEAGFSIEDLKELEAASTELYESAKAAMTVHWNRPNNQELKVEEYRRLALAISAFQSPLYKP